MGGAFKRYQVANAVHSKDVRPRWVLAVVIREGASNPQVAGSSPAGRASGTRARGAPAAMDLLSDPVALVERKHLHEEEDGYQIAYRTGGL